MHWIVILSILLALPQATPDVRGVRWGMTRKQVEKIEGKLKQSDYGLVRADELLLGEKVMVAFRFLDKGKLNSILLMFRRFNGQTHATVDSSKPTLDSTLLLLTKKYGNPDTIKIDTALGASSGIFFYDYAWQTDRTWITLSCMVVGFRSTIYITYHHLPRPKEMNAEGL